MAAAAAAAVGVVAVRDPSQPGHYPGCPFLAVTGLYCPGCGSLRAVHALTRGDVVAAGGLNPLALAGLLLLAVIWARWSWARLGGRQRAPLARAGWVWALLGVVLAFGVVRNLPFGALLAP